MNECARVYRRGEKGECKVLTRANGVTELPLTEIREATEALCEAQRTSEGRTRLAVQYSGLLSMALSLEKR